MFLFCSIAIESERRAVGRTRPSERQTKTGKTAGKNAERSLGRSGDKILKLQETIKAQRRELREMEARIAQLVGRAAHHDDSRAERDELKNEVRELTRANREHVKRNELLRAANLKLKAVSNSRRPAAESVTLDFADQHGFADEGSSRIGKGLKGRKPGRSNANALRTSAA
jgi:predicted RNase H-like nuclease (RuvC/YqgF family)